MEDVEPVKVTALRAIVADRLGLDTNQIQALECTTPDGWEDPLSLTLVIDRDDSLDENKIEAALKAVQHDLWQHAAAPTERRWRYRS